MNTTRDIATYLKQHEAKPLLRFITCGSVDDGKSTLIGRLLYDSKRLFDDQLAALEQDSRRHGTQGERIDYALLLDGLAAEREQGITIDVAYRYFDTDKRKFIVADCPGHEQYTRNMATGASTADLAVVLVDARKGLLTQTHRHSYIVSLLGIRHVVLAVNKMDLVDFDEAVFARIAADYRALARRLGIAEVACIPLSALEGDNLSSRSARTPWYRGPALLEHLEQVQVDAQEGGGSLRLPVQWVNRPHQNFRGYAGTLAAGQVKPGDEVIVLPSARRSRVSRVLDADGEVAIATAGQAVTLTLVDEIDISRGDVIAAAGDPPEVADQFAAHLLWMSDAPLLPGRPYWLKIGARTVSATVTEIKHRIDVNTQEHLAAKRLELNEVGYCNLSLDEPIPFEAYARNRTLGGFILIDRYDNGTAAAGTLDFALRRAGNVHWQHVDVDKAARARQKGQVPKVLWFTGLSGAGKSTIANLVDKRLHALGYHSFLLDGDNVRHGLNRDLGFTDEDRVENIRRVAEVAKLMTDAGLIVLVSFISPFRAERRMARARFDAGEFVEVFVDVPLAVAEARDVKGLYRKARAGLIPNFTGIDSPYEAPEHPELHLDAGAGDPETMALQVLAHLGLD
ncbi:sulfate adenylyltransferase subunit CysN [Pseudoxanthomonas sp. F37]|uniref:sulfate adenylyltransferase subunit CysN n=1 Tax=Pseudoxanthomonas TaxID=83618 RepID=UPI001FD4D834|nr:MULTISPECIES: sulfate adenylyltransferase subunit CysN [Pseudoxanthomonas]UOV04490.1 sulfate adenylyltransferase subunit CysN [Pseudoxanthomonas mexicana]UOV09496.1 sulfate adenylyltransferase subunit CysN [Pseudoxanthomonas sp. F37]